MRVLATNWHPFQRPSPDARFADTVSLARGICGFFGKPVEHRGGAGVHPQAAGTPCEAIVSGRIAGMVASIRNRMGRTVCVGLSMCGIELPFEGFKRSMEALPRTIWSCICGCQAPSRAFDGMSNCCQGLANLQAGNGPRKLSFTRSYPRLLQRPIAFNGAP